MASEYYIKINFKNLHLSFKFKGINKLNKNIYLMYIIIYTVHIELCMHLPASLIWVNDPLTFPSTDPCVLGQTHTLVLLAQWCPLCSHHLLAPFCIADRKSQKMSASSLQLLCTNSTGVSREPTEPRRATSNLATSLRGQSHTAECWRGALDSRTARNGGRVCSQGRNRKRKLQANG